ncbi:hypothetical protein PAXINDRAFT_16927 [Paxillus involutus ATCC 200175]|uniref:Uncharacterized protein n=1 Tax=Paxillus involutus ATCC 200175 TaxID=664439 RepID=A0A0C9TGV3_PAXIN|nr:hypothetical protein PAXINDRAFT_16927 [Paxillus involutus ATCC 200175]
MSWSSSPVADYNTLRDRIFSNIWTSDDDCFSEHDFETHGDTVVSNYTGSDHTDTQISQHNPAPLPAEIVEEFIVDELTPDKAESQVTTNSEWSTGTDASGFWEDGLDGGHWQPGQVDEHDGGPGEDTELTSTSSEHLSNIEIRVNAKGQQEAYCALCEEWVSLGRSKHSLYVYYTHTGSKVCQKAGAQKKKETVIMEEAHLRQQLFTSVSQSPRCPLPSIRTNSESFTLDGTKAFARPSSFHIPASFSPLQTTPPIPQSTLCQPNPQPLVNHRATHSPSPGLQVRTSQVTTSCEHHHEAVLLSDTIPPQCKGVQLDGPIGTIFDTYPWTQHEYGAKSLGAHKWQEKEGIRVMSAEALRQPTLAFR